MFPLFAPRILVKNLSEYTLRPYIDPDDHTEFIDMINSRYIKIGDELDLVNADKDLTDIPGNWLNIGGEIMLIIHGGKIVGALGLRPIKENRYGAEADWLFFLSEYEGKGLSLLLMKWALGWCKQRGITFLEAWSYERWKSAHKIYREMGFAQNGIKRLYRRNPDRYGLYFEMEVTPKIYNRMEKMLKGVPDPFSLFRPGKQTN